MKILFATGHPHLPQFSGGSQSSIHELALLLARDGHQVSVLAALWSKGYLGWRNRILMKLLRRHTIRDRVPGYDVFRKWFVWEDADEVAAKIKPDVAIVMAMKPVAVARSLIAAGVPTIVYFRDVEFSDLGGDPSSLEATTYIANSHFTAARMQQAFGIRAEVVPPLFDAEKYRVEPRETGRVTFINPSLVKGRDIAIEVAARNPDIPFQFIESWPLVGSDLADLRARLDPLPNVTFVPRTDDMKSIYANTRILLVPSQWEEAWGRVATEAQFSGIPVVASDLGGLPEAIGPGGVLVPPRAPAEEWSAAVRRLWEDEEFYRRTSRAARAHSTRPAIEPGAQLSRLIGIFESANGGERGLQGAA